MLLFGAPGAGKGTQGKILGVIPHFFHCACGDVFRSLRTNTPLGKIFVEYSSRGELVPDQPTIDLWRQFIDTSIHIGKYNPESDTMILDGIPRNVAQAEILKDVLDVVGVYYLHCNNFENLVKRIQRRALKENRLDDANLEVIRHRIKTYEAETAPLLKYYGLGLVHDIEADQSPAKVLGDILRIAVTK
jgi:adenylate kinase